ncbi:DUF4258 domain-containing protein [Halobacterium salinarum]|uniref:DUF4258 domain-containing protein n=1 Tax=Halobacterium salinarum TaxID=2242 RepID=UPI0025533245|nr:DUF4258 domain-containing protein [Halobacterium salinarum]MDL0133570.1 DUF4258 domain-containing protein [Halobacterium salinarum]
MSLSIPRDPSHYQLTIHAKQRRRERDIPLDAIAATIEEGEVRRTHKSGSRLFVSDVEGCDEPLGVVADVTDGDIQTVCWRTS